VTILLAGTYYRYHQEEELKISRLNTNLAQAQLQRTQAQLEALKMQLQPHFMFNALNSISSLLDEDTEAAEVMLARLGDFLRLTLDNSGAQEVTLQKEINFVRCYLEIERVRFSDSLTVLIEIEPGAGEALVPNLILQPIVENSIQHGIMNRVGNGRIEILARRENDRLHLEVKDNGPGLHSESRPDHLPKRGLGFALTHERLERLYGTQQTFRLCHVPEGGLQVILEIPFRTASDLTTEEAIPIEAQVAAP
jgi:LytS/YehU family sensor histidine kinase